MNKVSIERSAGLLVCGGAAAYGMACGGKIKPGERYEHTAITPDHDDYGNTRWVRYRTHLSPMICYDETRYSPVPEELTITARKDEQR